MKKGALPIPYIITLILGVIVVALLAYWFVNSGGKGTNIGKEAECTARKTEFCATQLSEHLEKARECDENRWPNDKVCSFCKGIIPGWDGKLSGVTC